MVGLLVALITLVSMIAFATGVWRPKWVREQEFSEPHRRTTDAVDRTYTAEVLSMQCSILGHVIPEKERIRNLSDVA